jgi:hypothetical protein
MGWNGSLWVSSGIVASVPQQAMHGGSLVSVVCLYSIGSPLPAYVQYSWARRTSSAMSSSETISERRGLRDGAAVLQATAAGTLPACISEGRGSEGLGASRRGSEQAPCTS